jgi:hypothetical protein
VDRFPLIKEAAEQFEKVFVTINHSPEDKDKENGHAVELPSLLAGLLLLVVMK